jgi:hypothetical protein
MAAQPAATNTRPLVLPALIAVAGDRAAPRFLEFFTVNIRNRNTRAAYGRAAVTSCAGAKGRGLTRSGGFSRSMWPRISNCCRASARPPPSSNIWPVSGCCSTGWQSTRKRAGRIVSLRLPPPLSNCALDGLRRDLLGRGLPGLRDADRPRRDLRCGNLAGFAPAVG